MGGSAQVEQGAVLGQLSAAHRLPPPEPLHVTAAETLRDLLTNCVATDVRCDVQGDAPLRHQFVVNERAAVSVRCERCALPPTGSDGATDHSTPPTARRHRPCAFATCNIPSFAG